MTVKTAFEAIEEALQTEHIFSAVRRKARVSNRAVLAYLEQKGIRKKPQS